MALNSQDEKTLEKSLQILKPGGKIISFLSRKVKKQAKQLGVNYLFLFMQANGKQLSEISSLIEADIIHPVLDTVFPFEQLNEAMSYVQSGRAKEKVVIKVK